MKNNSIFLVILVICFFFSASCKKKDNPPTGVLQLAWTKIGSRTLDLQGVNKDLPVDTTIVIGFNNILDTNTIRQNVLLLKVDNTPVICNYSFLNDCRNIVLKPVQHLDNRTVFSLKFNSGIKGIAGETFPGMAYTFTTVNGKLLIESITLNDQDFSKQQLTNISWTSTKIEVTFSTALDPSNYQSSFALAPGITISFVLSNENKKVTITNSTQLNHYTPYYFFISNNLKSINGFDFDGFNNTFYTLLDSTLKFPLIPDEQLLTLIQEHTFRYFYDFAHPSCGMARERNTSGDIVTTGGSGFGVMALVVGIDHGFITRSQGLTHLSKILSFLETCDRFHGAWPHWMYGSTGKTVPFTQKDDGADLVETSYMVEGLYTMRQYLDSNDVTEKALINRIDTLTDAVEYDWFTRGENALYWHWSPNYGWAMNMKIQGYNETLITYIVAASSTTHPVSATVYHQGYARNGNIRNGNFYYGYKLPLGEAYGGPLFFTHYSFLGLDPRNLQDTYANYWEQNVNQSLINYSYCVDNPNHYIGYSNHSWGLTASDNPWGYDAHSPTNDLGVITPSAAVSALPCSPEQSMNAIRHFYYILGDRLWGEYGFYDAFDVNEGWWADSYLAIDQGPIICMIENSRTGLLWNLFMSSPKVPQALTKLGFTY